MLRALPPLACGVVSGVWQRRLRLVTSRLGSCGPRAARRLRGFGAVDVLGGPVALITAFCLPEGSHQMPGKQYLQI